jgi:hypothetical protein
MSDQDDSKLNRAGAVLIRVGAAAAGPVLTATIGPEGAAAVTEAIAQAGEQVVGWLDERRGGRIKRTLEDASEQIAVRRAKGDTVRADWSDPENGDAAALFEAVVAAAADSAEDRKCAVLANIYASLAFDSEMTIDDALLCIRRVRDASWRQLVCLAYLAAEDRQEERELAAIRGDEGEAIARSLPAAEMVELAEALGLVGVSQPNGPAAQPSATLGGGGFYTSSLRKWVPTALGHAIMRLGRVSAVVTAEDLDGVARALAADGT